MPRKSKTAHPEAEWVEIGKLAPWADNPRDNEGAVGPVAESIQRFGWTNPILARREDGFVIAGHTRLKAAQHLGLDRVLVRFLDIDEGEARALALADNRLGELAEWQGESLGRILSELRAEDVPVSGLGWDDDSLDELIAVFESPSRTSRPDGDNRAPPRREGQADSTPGEVYQLGRHRLACGSCADPALWEALLQGEQLDVVWTDPPYGVAVVGGARGVPWSYRKKRGGATIKNDAMKLPELTEFLSKTLGALKDACRPGASWYVAAPSSPRMFAFCEVLRELGLWRQTLCWVKDRFVLGASDYHYRYEIVFYGWVEGAARSWCGRRDLDTVQEFPSPRSNKEHPTMKPVELIRFHLENSSRQGDIVGDGFGGSGSTMVAAELCGRTARLTELDPAYCDVIRRRWTRWARERNLDPGAGALEPLG